MYFKKYFYLEKIYVPTVNADVTWGIPEGLLWGAIPLGRVAVSVPGRQERLW